MKFEMPKFDAEQAQAFVASLPARSRLLTDSFISNVKELILSSKRARKRLDSVLRCNKRSPSEGGMKLLRERAKRRRKRRKGPAQLCMLKNPTQNGRR